MMAVGTFSTAQPRSTTFPKKRGSVLRFCLIKSLVILFAFFAVQSTAAQTFIELYPFNSTGNLSDGGWPEAGLVRDAAGNLYGTTFYGGGGGGCDIYYLGCGTIFKVALNGTESVLHAFSGLQDGWNPTANLILDSAGNLYGTTPLGGAHGLGVVFELDSDGNETVLHSFARTDGANPNAGLVQDASGNLYGTTQYGGRGCDFKGCGTVFELSPNGQITTLHSFIGFDGASPLGGVIVDTSGNVYGTTWLGGLYGYGTVFKIDPGGNGKILHNFSGGDDGANPLDSLILDQAGNLFGTTSAGGAYFGILFAIDPAGNEHVLHRFTGGTDGAYPYANLILDSSGNLYGTASQGGSTGAGSVFEFSHGALTVLYDFAGTTDGSNPMGGLVMDSAGNLYGTAVQAGTYGWGSVFEIQIAGPSVDSKTIIER
jgi:uncharacterized repeat protein (TIGR03803 family)